MKFSFTSRSQVALIILHLLHFSLTLSQCFLSLAEFSFPFVLVILSLSKFLVNEMKLLLKILVALGKFSRILSVINDWCRYFLRCFNNFSIFGLFCSFFSRFLLFLVGLSRRRFSKIFLGWKLDFLLNLRLFYSVFSSLLTCRYGDSCCSSFTLLFVTILFRCCCFCFFDRLIINLFLNFNDFRLLFNFLVNSFRSFLISSFEFFLLCLFLFLLLCFIFHCLFFSFFFSQLLFISFILLFVCKLLSF